MIAQPAVEEPVPLFVWLELREHKTLFHSINGTVEFSFIRVLVGRVVSHARVCREGGGPAKATEGCIGEAAGGGTAGGIVWGLPGVAGYGRTRMAVEVDVWTKLFGVCVYVLNGLKQNTHAF